MALNLGDINFGLGVDTRRLNSSVQEVVKFGRAVETASSASSAASKKAATALRQQEKAALSALQQTVRFNEQVRKAGAPTRLLTDSARAFREYTKSVTSGQLATLNFQRSQSKFQADMARSTRSLNRFKEAQNTSNPNTLAASMNNLASAATLAVGPLSGVGARISALTAIANRSNLAMVGLIGGVTAAAVAMGRFSTGAVMTAIELDRIDARLVAVTGSSAAAAEAFADIQDLADATGTELISVANGYAKIAAAAQGTALEGEAASQVFEDILFGAAQFRIGTEELNGVLRAFEQIMSKGVVQSEELRGQLGDRLVGAFNIAADAMGVTTQELNRMLRAGEVISDDFLPRFAAAFREAVGADQVRRVTGLQASMSRFANAQTAFNAAFDETFGISELFQASLDGMSNLLNLVANNMDSLAIAAATVSGALFALAAPRILTALVGLAGIIKNVSVAVLGLNAAIMANPLGGLATILTRVGIAAVGAVAGFGLMSSAMAGTDSAQQRLIDTVDQFIQAQEAARASASDTTASLREEVETQMRDLERELSSLQVTIPTGLSFENDNRNGIQRFLDELPRNLSMQLGMGDPNTREWLENQAAIRGVEAQAAQLQTRLDELRRIEAEQLALQEERAAAQERVITAAEEGAVRSIARLNEEAQAISMGTGAVQALKAEFQQIDAIARFTEQLERANVEAELITGLTDQFATALEGLQEAAQASVLEDASEQIARIRQEIEAITSGGDLEGLKRSFEISDAVSSFEQQLIAAGLSLDVVEERTNAFRQAMIELDEATAAQNTASVIADITAEIDRMNQEAIALQQGEAAVRALNQEFENSQTIDTFRARLEDAGVESSILEGLIRSLTGALFTLQSVAGQVRIDAALDSAAEATDRLRRETVALAGGEDAFTSFRNAERVASSLATLETSLRDAGVAEADITAQLGERRTALEANISAQTAYDAALRASRSGGGSGGRSAAEDAEKELERLQEATTTLVQLQTIAASGADAFAHLHASLSVAEQVENYRNSLVEAGLAQSEVNTRVDQFRLSAQAYLDANGSIEAMTDTIQNAASSLQSMVDQAATFAAIDFENLVEFGRSGAEAIAEYERALRSMGLEQEEINRLLEEYIALQRELQQQEEGLSALEALTTGVQDTIMEGWGDVADVMADALTSGEFDMQSLADISQKVASEILSSFLELAVIQPLLNSIFGSFGGFGGGATFGQLFSGSGGNFFGTLFSRKGNAFGEAGAMGVSMMRKGGILTGPTAFGMGDGGLAIGGEAGDEGILPLARDSSGDLGVVAVGGGSGNTINFNFPPGTDVDSFRKSESQMAAVASRVTQRGARNR